MGWGAWIPVLLSSTVAAAAAFVLGTYCKANIEQGFQGDLRSGLEALKSQMHREEERVRRELDAKESEISSLRSEALSGRANRYAAVDKRRVQAVETLWSFAMAHGDFRTAIMMTKALDLEKAIELSAKGDANAQKIRALADLIWKACRLDEVKADLGRSAACERPFLSPMAWALYCTYSTMLVSQVFLLGAVRGGIGNFFKKEQLTTLMKTAMPDMALLIDHYGVAAIPHLVCTMEERLLSELKANLESRETDAQSIKRSAEILTAVDDVEAAIRRTRVFRTASRQEVALS